MEFRNQNYEILKFCNKTLNLQILKIYESFEDVNTILKMLSFQTSTIHFHVRLMFYHYWQNLSKTFYPKILKSNENLKFIKNCIFDIRSCFPVLKIDEIFFKNLFIIFENLKFLKIFFKTDTNLTIDKAKNGLLIYFEKNMKNLINYLKEKKIENVKVEVVVEFMVRFYFKTNLGFYVLCVND